jgi:hypothetical protein
MTITTPPGTMAPSLPTGGTGRGTGEAPARDAWQREMERAQARDWLRPAATEAAVSTRPATASRGAATNPHAPPAPARPPQAPVAWMAAPETVVPTTAMHRGDSTTAAPALRPHAMHTASASIAPDAAAPPSRHVIEARIRTAAPSSTAPARVVSGAPSGQDPVPVRTHIEWQADAAHVWLGVDAQGAEQLATIARAVVQRLNDHGIRVARLVCNGIDLPVSASTRSPTESDVDPVLHITPHQEF